MTDWLALFRQEKDSVQAYNRIPDHIASNAPVAVWPSANGYWIAPLACPMEVPEGAVQRWDKESMFAFLDAHFPEKVYVTAQFDPGGHA